eukprot:CAMPEP_0205960270 /NCGR_PEP_ID=MMETSP1459-20131121/60683_1 /ASSEMBLY_ACC=CAM_ASM_001120 /TAXON_ID=41880 /ORGANISM="Pycnococcus provasolii, Strain RCC931" /LENGTH=80 /DNA_ID=CAMNT_0053332915 /DNA_START=121 /DNA_END=360 /DNA_ORIENTATION=-
MSTAVATLSASPEHPTPMGGMICFAKSVATPGRKNASTSAPAKPSSLVSFPSFFASMHAALSAARLSLRHPAVPFCASIS